MIVKLQNRVLIKVSGNDACKFLNSQFSNKVSDISNNDMQINAYCQHQGKVIAIIWVICLDDNFYLSFPKDIKNSVLDKLNLFKLMSEVKFTDVSDTLFQYGIIDEICQNSIKITGKLSLLISSEKIKFSFDELLWEQNCIKLNLPEIYNSTSEKFIPQALNLDIDEIGVSFSKGCYPGQEVVARMHYLGKPKRRLFQFESKFEPATGDTITVKESESIKSSGVVIRVAKNDDSYYFLGTLEIKHSNKKIYLNNDVNKPLNIINA